MKTSKGDKILLYVIGGMALYFIVRTIQNYQYRKQAMNSNFGGYEYGDIAEEDPHTLITHS
jgi:hypothetical protein